MTEMNRRQWIHTLAGGAAAALLAPTSGLAIEPIVRSSKSPLRLSLAAYSFNSALSLKGKPSMTLSQFIDYAAGLPIDAVELTSYYFPETSPEFLGKIRAQCTRQGLDVSGGAVGNDFCVADPVKRAAQIQLVRDWIAHLSRIGGKSLRIFAGNLPKGDTEAAARNRVIAAIEELAPVAAQYGVFLAVENHGGITATPEQLLAIVKPIRSDFVGINLDSGNFRTEDPYADLAKIAPYAVNAQIKTDIQRAGQKKKEPADLAKVVGILKSAGYRGHVVLEYEGAEPVREAIPRHIDTLRKLIA
ncbi:sugar phosphate isomerase/epimerase family protein [Tuwongella immobilis]|uniref:Xylose isomerase-like TIM barrel domain-containing protein n=1 Tax=Tuwongella immobilis TaxID=692036 RepID=A0A6C2YN27_9BACT|nr:sugar phosphate isomerase/epimerase family protein [Tuwongella immobilis]VIP02777.1 Sugar phosphate isomerase/epimerase OS=Singulisphaera acidiphila (strain ATCC BAA-1392 / DSM 18658 / VKM B-2454 / MOB10) GN=Sinac_5984 PE=4 SV=1: AP_endonuc_2 [Tuwongella immobilis]VTS02420.1 Sugar phosphate isomerase/epimerase OS=Singulisphaera acidiphila (strain ATCC BAA-1392 / DSM 18658 / VKM B-2454 / MOB10) GN=Sinac_5984 PE=4 SV=1: AP_endonuc_2 [Tuwongella immobilis]